MALVIITAVVICFVAAVSSYWVGQNSAGRRYQYTVAQLRVQARRSRFEKDQAEAALRQLRLSVERDNHLRIVK
jgi:hypothetical protein